jgi:hypothetical protein
MSEFFIKDNFLPSYVRGCKKVCINDKLLICQLERLSKCSIKWYFFSGAYSQSKLTGQLHVAGQFLFLKEYGKEK